MPMNKNLRTILQYIFFLGLGIFLTWLSLKGLNKENIAQIKFSLRNARYWLIIPVFTILFLSHYIRAIRWRLLIEPLGYMPSKANTVAAVFIGYMANQAFPRLGEVLKCTVLARYEKIPADKLVGTIILERLIDAITLLIMFGITLAIQPKLYSQLLDTFFNQAEKENEEKGGIPLWLIAIIVVIIICILVSLWMYKKKKTINDAVKIFRRIWQSVIQGVSTIKHLKKRRQFVLLTIALWTAYVSGGYLGFMALQETSHYGIREAFSVLSAGSVGMIIPAPGGIGTYAYMIQMTMQLYGLNPSIAIAFGWILWLAQTTIILIGGLISFVSLPYYNKKKIQGEKS
jgi:glycosyltransferase 2 family protein